MITAQRLLAGVQGHMDMGYRWHSVLCHAERRVGPHQPAAVLTLQVQYNLDQSWSRYVYSNWVM